MLSGKVLRLTLAFLLVFSFSASYSQTIFYVDDDATGANNGTSWADAFTNLQNALAAADGGAEIWVAEGVYYPDEGGTMVNGDRSSTFYLKNGVRIYGGFPNGGASFDERNWTTYLTILSGDIDHNDLNTDGNHIAETSTDIFGDNAFHVVTSSGTDNTALLDGFIITAGKALSNVSIDNLGGGMYNLGGSPSLKNIIFMGNLANGEGGGMYNKQSSPILINVSFNNNSAENGGGMYNEFNSAPTLSNVNFSGNYANRNGGGLCNEGDGNLNLITVTFSDNSAISGGGMYNSLCKVNLTDCNFANNSAIYGGGMYNYGSDVILNKVTFSNNTAEAFGGGLDNNHSSPMLSEIIFSNNSASMGGGLSNFQSSPTLLNILFTENSADVGGAMCDFKSNSKLTNVVFSNNSAISNGAGMDNFVSNPILTNVVFFNNSAESGGAISNSDSSPNLINVTISHNHANDFGGGIVNSNNSNPVLTNVIIWGNTAPTGPNLINFFSTPTITYSIVEGCGSNTHNWDHSCGTNGGGNLDLDPLFVDTAQGDLHLNINSPAIDAGINTECPAIDLDGNIRPYDGNGDGTASCDLGAFEFGSMPTSLSDKEPVQESFIIGQNKPNPFTSVTYINITASMPAHLTLRVFNTLGQQVATLLEEPKLAPGKYLVRFDASHLPAGVYLCRMDVYYSGKHFVVTRKLSLLK